MQVTKIIAIAGLNGSGKTAYVNQMRKQLVSDKVRYIAFCDTYGSITDKAYYLQQRWNQHDIDNEMPITGEVLERSYILSGNDSPERRAYQQHLYDLFQFHSLLDKYVISLSSGELRKYQIIKTLLSAPSTLILDNPFIGLDAATRQNLKDLILSLSKEKQLTIYLIVARPEDIPDYADDIIWITPKLKLTSEPRHLDEEKQQSILSRAYSSNMTFSEEVVKMNDVSIKYGERTILSHVNWTIKNGECWALCGQNGSGKSTLLSLICADNPQAYACDISLFGRKRGSGESIWEIKRHIGYVSPEMHRSYHHNIPVIQVMASGLKDTVGLYTRTNEAERECCRWWMRIFGIEQLEKRPFLSLSSGEQRLVLVARAFVKDPQLLILDEPLHGLDNKNKTLVKDIIETYSKLPNKTLIMVTHYDEELPGCFNQKKELLKLQ